MQDLNLILIFIMLPILLAAFFYFLRTNKRRKIRDSLSQYRNDILQAYTELNTLLNSGRYIENRTINLWIKKWSFLFPLLKDYIRSKIVDVDLNEKIRKLFKIFDSTEEVISKRNEKIIQWEAKSFEVLFNTIEKYPLTKSQIRSIITDEYFNLVVAGAGTGKTSTIVGKTAYILRKGLAQPNEVLLLSFARDAKKEMYLRILSCLGINLDVKTFHSLGLSVIAEVQGTKPSVTELSSGKVKFVKKVEEFIKQNLHDELFSKLLNEYFLFHNYPYERIFNFKTKGEYINYLKKFEVRSLKGDRVKSFEECEIANFLYLNGIEYEYERDYEVPTASRKHRQYKPDFYLTKYGIYIEHFALDEKGNTPPFIDKHNYTNDLMWKRQLHKTNKTELIETYSYEKFKGVLLSNLKQKLRKYNVEFREIPKDRIFEDINKLGYVNSFASLLSTFLNLYKSANLKIEDLKEKAQKSQSKERSQAFITVFSYILTSYNNYLISSGKVDFNDMLTLSERYIAQNKYPTKYRYILVDEFQDISQSRYRLLKTLLEKSLNCNLFCVGDDWQSIYRFTGSDLSLMTDFQKYFGFTKPLILEKTFRFNDKICNFASKFILQNPKQIVKELSTIEKTRKPSVKVIFTESEDEAIFEVLEEINSRALKKTELFIIGRYNFQQPENLSELRKRFRKTSIRFITAHSSKGREADYVILIGMKSGLYGFPCQIEDDPLLDLVLATSDRFPNSEERRLLYVAVTRAKKEVFLLTDTKSPSQFITEIINEVYDVHVTGQNSGRIKCPECITGYIEHVHGVYGLFYSCGNYPYCDYRPQACPECNNGFLQKESETEYACVKGCGFRAQICPSCNEGYLKIVNGPYSDFIGCSNFPDCRYKE